MLSKIREFDPANKLASWLAAPRNAQLTGRLLTDAARYSLDALADQRVQHFIRDTAMARLDQIDLAKAGGQMLDILTSERRHQAVLDELLRMLNEVMAHPEVQTKLAEAIAEELRSLEYLGWTLRRLGADQWGGQFSTAKLVSGLSSLIAEVSHDPQHALRLRFDHYMMEFIARLKNDPEMHLRGQEIKAHFLQHPQLAETLAQTWRDVLTWLKEDLGREDSTVRVRIEESAQLLGEKLQADQAMQSWVNEQLLSVAPQWIEKYREDIRRYIISRVDAWGADELVSALETNIGKDLQFIRINGTLVGGTIGLLIYTLTQWLR